LEVSEWKQTAGSGSSPSVETVYTPATLPGLGASPTYLHSQGTVGIDWRTSPGYSRRGGFYGVTIHDFADPDSQFGFKQTDYEVIQHLPLLREAWVLSFHGRVETTSLKNDQQIPFFMLPANGGGSDLRGFSSWRFRDRHSLLLQAEWRVIVNRYLDMAVFYDTGKVTANRGDLNLDGLKDDFGLGFRMHGPMATPLRIEFAKSKEGLVIVFGASAVF
jgi:surface antigen Omp85-like protein